MGEQGERGYALSTYATLTHNGGETYMVTEVLLGVTVLLLLVVLGVLVTVARRKGPDRKDIEASLSSTWRMLGLDRAIGSIETHAREVKDSYRSFEQLLRVPTERGRFGELSLETILGDQLPPDMFGMRENVLNGGTPDANIRSTVGRICIDSKFPLENYRNMLDAQDDGERERLKKQFIKVDIRGHLDKVAEDYVRPDRGSADFAFAYIPSEAVYYFLQREAFDLLREYSKRGVAVVSPLSLSFEIRLIRAGVHAKRLSEEAEKVSNSLVKLERQFGEVDETWRVLYTRHLKNLQAKADELDGAYQKLRDEFQKVSEMAEEEQPEG